jgi:lipid II:glycine glycyltransferase (peptidoglycan interpeptide bridge formation enzyme)
MKTSFFQSKKVNDLTYWNDIIKNLPGAHLLQTREWSKIKSSLGWTAQPVLWEDKAGKCQAACLILKRQVVILPRFFSASILYAPKGPILDWSNPELVDQVLGDLKVIARSERSIFIKIDPDVICGTGVPGSDKEKIHEVGCDLREKLTHSGWTFSNDQIQFRNSVIIDLEKTDDQILANMKQKTRYNIHLAEKKGVMVRKGTLADTAMLYKMYAETSIRNGFIIRDRYYYEHVWQILYNAGMLEFLIATFDEQPIAGLVLFHFGKRAYYFYGMSIDRHRELMPTYLLQFEAIRTARALGCAIYDLWGAPDVFNDQDPMWGVYRFKEGLGGEVIRTIGAWDFPVKPSLYKLYTGLMPRFLAIMRRRGKINILQEVS